MRHESKRFQRVGLLGLICLAGTALAGTALAQTQQTITVVPTGFTLPASMLSPGYVTVGDTISFDVVYDADNLTPGMALRVHYDSTDLTLLSPGGVTNIYAPAGSLNLTGDFSAPEAPATIDPDGTTDSFVLISSQTFPANSTWPPDPRPVTLATLSFSVNNTFDATNGTRINFVTNTGFANVLPPIFPNNNDVDFAAIDAAAVTAWQAVSPNGANSNVGTLTLALAPPVISITATDPDAAENPIDTGTFTIACTGTFSNQFTVDFTVGGTATQGTDYVALGATSATFTACGAGNEQVVTITPIDDAISDNNETVILTLTPDANMPPAFTLDPAATAATVTIADDEVPPTVTITRLEDEDGVITDVGEGEGVINVATITCTGTGMVSVPFTITGAGINVLPASPIMLNCPDPVGVTVTVEVPDNDVADGPRNVTIGDASTGGPVVINVVDNDAAPVPIPTLSQWAMVLMAGLIALGGMVTLRRQA